MEQIEEVVASDNNDCSESDNLGVETATAGSRSSVIVENPAQFAKHQVSQLQASERTGRKEVEMNNNNLVFDLTASDIVDLGLEYEDTSDVKLVKEVIHHEMVGRVGGRTDTSCTGVDISLVLPANYNRNHSGTIKRSEVRLISDC